MTRTVLGEHARTEIREAVKRCRTSKEIAAEVDRLAGHFNIGRDRVYAITRDLRTRRKTRADKGRRIADISTDENLRLVAGWVLEYGVSPSEAIVMARQRGMEIPVEFPTLVKYLRESGLDKKTRLTPQLPHRRFEASAPGEMFQFDISGLKQRWFDHQTRRIISVSSLEVSKNHENEKASRTRVWRFALVDDYSRRCFVRYVGVAKPNSSHVVDFLLLAYSELGVPLRLYTDNDKIIKFGRNARTTQILNKVLSDQGGYENTFHMPGNSRASGKVERIHQTIEQCEKFIGVRLAERDNPLTLEELNNSFAPNIEKHLNNTVHSTTGQTPMDRWESTFSVIRRLDYATLRSAFMADEHEVKVKGDLSFRLKGQTFQLPTSDMYPFANWIGQKLRVVFPDQERFFIVIGLDGNEYDVVKEAQAADVAGDFKTTRQTDAERLRKEVRALAREDAKRIKTAATATQEPIRFFDSTDSADSIDSKDSGVLRFPKPETTVDVDRVVHHAPGRVAAGHDPAVHYWEAVSDYQHHFASKGECKTFMDSLFASRDEESWVLQSDIEKAIDDRSARRQTSHLKAVG